MKIGNSAALEAALSVMMVPESIREDEFTLNDIADKAGIPYKTAASQMKEHVRKGLFLVRRAFVDGKWVNAYSMKPPVANPPKGKKSSVAKRR